MDAIAVLEQELEHKRLKLLALDEEIAALETALSVLSGSYVSRAQESPAEKVLRPSVERVEVQPRQVPPVHASPVRQEQPPTFGVHCPACGSGMERGSRTLSSGRTVPLLICVDSGCNNEIIAA